MAVDPPLVIIGGSVAKAREFYQDAMWESIKEIPFPSVLDNLTTLLDHPITRSLITRVAIPSPSPSTLEYLRETILSFHPANQA